MQRAAFGLPGVTSTQAVARVSEIFDEALEQFVGFLIITAGFVLLLAILIIAVMASATGEITRNVQQAAKGTEEVAGSMGSVEQGSSETNASADRVKTASQALAEEAERLKSEVDSFLQQIKAA